MAARIDQTQGGWDAPPTGEPAGEPDPPRADLWKGEDEGWCAPRPRQRPGPGVAALEGKALCVASVPGFVSLPVGMPDSSPLAAGRRWVKGCPIQS
jgi:hypothetical protein